jgi:hypothetical protein
VRRLRRLGYLGLGGGAPQPGIAGGFPAIRASGPASWQPCEISVRCWSEACRSAPRTLVNVGGPGGRIRSALRHLGRIAGLVTREGCQLVLIVYFGLRSFPVGGRPRTVTRNPPAAVGTNPKKGANAVAFNTEVTGRLVGSERRSYGEFKDSNGELQPGGFTLWLYVTEGADKAPATIKVKGTEAAAWEAIVSAGFGAEVRVACALHGRNNGVLAVLSDYEILSEGEQPLKGRARRAAQQAA